MALTGFSHKVTWSEFSPVDEPDGEEQADTHARFGITYAYSCNAAGVCSTRNVVVNVRMDQQASWAVRGASVRTAALLKHEQGHFDITALGARDAERQIRAITGSDGDDIRSQKDAIEAQVQSEIDAMNIAYDDDTVHGTDASAQARWNGRIAAARANATGTLSDVSPGSP